MKRRHRWIGLRPGDRSQLEREIEAEIRLHIEMREAQLTAMGLDAESANREAVRRFGRGEATRRELRAAAERRERRMRMRRYADGLVSDAGHGFRGVRRWPGLAVVVILTMALGIGANAAMFGIVDRLLVRGPLHVRESDRLMRFLLAMPRPGAPDLVTGTMGYAGYRTFRDGTRSFDGVASYSIVNDGVIGRGADAEQARIGAATADFFPLLGVSAALGRFFSEEEDLPGAGAEVAVIGWSTWMRRYGGDRSAIGRRIEAGQGEYTIIGVAPAGFTGVDLMPVDVWIPMSVRSRGITSDWQNAWDAQWLRVIGRLPAAVPVAQATEDANHAFRAAYTGPEPELRAASVRVVPVRYTNGGREPLEVSVSRWLLGVALVVLLIACANVMNLYLARALQDRRDIAVRVAMGIDRWRLVRFLMMRGMILALLGGSAALLVAAVGGAAVRNTLLPDVDWGGPVVDARILAFTAFVSVAVGLLTSIVPALRSSRVDLSQDLKDGQRATGRSAPTLRNGLTLVQATFSVVLLVGAGLFVRSLIRAKAVDLGIEPDRTVSVALRWLPLEGAWRELRPRYDAATREALVRLQSEPQIEHAAIVVGTPFRSSFTVGLRIAGRDSIPQYPGGGPYISAITDEYFETVGLSLLEGRSFTPADRQGSEPVAIVDRAMAKALFAPGQALGQCLYIEDGTADPPCSRIVGIVEEAHRFGLRDDAALQYYVPLGQETGFSGSALVFRPRPGASADLAAALRVSLASVDPAISSIEIVGFDREIEPLLRPWRLGATMFMLFGSLALLIAVIGVYSVVAFTTANRTREIGVRMAVGAHARDVIGLVVRQGAIVALAGLVLGALIALAAGHYIGDILFETSTRDPLVFGVVLVTMFAAALLASLIPALRAAHIDPVTALRID